MRFSLSAILAASVVLAAPAVPNRNDGSLVFGAEKTHVIYVRGRTINPNKITVAIGSTVRFEFGGNFQSVVEADFNAPCQPKDDGFASGQFTSTETVDKFDKGFEIKIEHGRPIWFYNGASQFCSEVGIVGVINPGMAKGQALEDFAFKAMQTSETVDASKRGGTDVDVRVQAKTAILAPVISAIPEPGY
ncbi:hypothetical protein BROUX41_006135 [Berkeleyomyces rouxiae]|uniref:uncharacterized protein n=1 Tax=Berkeleyomyces rouxiae TaxID=2035830 RepID=UPI003B7D9BCD